MKTVNFFYTDNASFKATNVTAINDTGTFIEYSREVMSEDGTIFGVDHRAILKVDLLYAVVKDHVNGSVTILPGLYDGFTVTPSGAGVERMNNILKDNAAKEARREQKALKERAKYEARQAKRRAEKKAEWVGSNPEPEQPKAKPASAIAQLKAAGLSDDEIATLQRAKIVKN